jgi:hypothetical protein
MLDWLILIAPWALLSVVTFLITLIVVPIIVIRVPADYYLDDDRFNPFPSSRPWWGHVLVVLKNLLGVVFLIGGIIMLVTPGPGQLSILLGLALMDFPGRRRLELFVLNFHPLHNLRNYFRARLCRPPLEKASTPPVLATINAIRKRAGQPPLEMPPEKPVERHSADEPREEYAHGKVPAKTAK